MAFPAQRQIGRSFPDVALAHVANTFTDWAKVFERANGSHKTLVAACLLFLLLAPMETRNYSVVNKKHVRVCARVSAAPPTTNPPQKQHANTTTAKKQTTTTVN